jgi:ATP-dependent Lhr-like helicase
MPLSVALGGGLLTLLGRYLEGRAEDPELEALRPLLELQQRWSALPTQATLLIEAVKSREGFHLFVYPFAGRLINEGAAAVMSLRAARAAPRTFSITSNDYGFELLCEEEFAVTEAELRRWLSPDDLIADLLASINVSDLARRQFRDIARIAGLVDPGTPRRGKTSRQLQVSSGLMFDVLERHDADNLLLAQARREVLDAQLDQSELATVLQALAARDWIIARPLRFTPLSFPLWADRLQTQTLSTESWQTRVEREARRLEKLAP